MNAEASDILMNAYREAGVMEHRAHTIIGEAVNRILSASTPPSAGEGEITITPDLRERLFDAACKMSLDNMRWLRDEIGKRIPTPPPADAKPEQSVEEEAQKYADSRFPPPDKGVAAILPNAVDFYHDQGVKNGIAYSSFIAGASRSKVGERMEDEKLKEIVREQMGPMHGSMLATGFKIARAVRDAIQGKGELVLPYARVFSHSEPNEYDKGWNACLARIRELNSPTTGGGKK